MSDFPTEKPVGCAGCEDLQKPTADDNRWSCFVCEGTNGRTYLPSDFKGCPNHSGGKIKGCASCVHIDTTKGRPFIRAWCNLHDFPLGTPFRACDKHEQREDNYKHYLGPVT